MSKHCVTTTAEHRSRCAAFQKRSESIFYEVLLLKTSLVKSYDELPLFLNAAAVAQTLGVSESSAYELLNGYVRES